MTIANTTPAQRLRTAFKTAGLNSRRVTVRHDHSTLRVTIRDASASLSKVKAIADQFVSVRRCEATGEILCGGNTFVDVSYTDALVAPVKAALVALLDPAADDEIVSLLGDYRAAKISRQRGAMRAEEVCIWGPGFDFRNSIACGITWAAERIAVANIDANASAIKSAV